MTDEMTDEKIGYKTHVFVCTNSPDRKGKCGYENSEKLRKDLKEQCFSEFGKGQVRVNASGCLGYCEHGIAAVIYSEGKDADWFLGLKKEDVDVLMTAVKKA